MSKHRRGIVIGSYVYTSVRASVDIREDDFIVCADGGFNHAMKDDVIPNLIVGDMDSVSVDIPDNSVIIVSPREKIDLDIMLAIKEVIKRDIDEIVIIGGFGGRIDQTLGIIAALAYTISLGKSCYIADGGMQLYMYREDENDITLEYRDNAYFSLLSYSNECRDICIRNAKYGLTDYLLTNTYPRGISNEFVDGDVRITKSGGLLIVTIVPKDSEPMFLPKGS